MLATSSAQLKELEAEADRLNNLLPSEIIHIRQKLTENEPCPVCGSLHHPFRDNAEQPQTINEADLEENKQKVQQNIDLIKVRIENIQKGITEFETYIKNFQDQYINSFNNLKECLLQLPDWENKLNNGGLADELLTIASQWNENKKMLENLALMLENTSAKLTAEVKSKVFLLENSSKKVSNLKFEEDFYPHILEQRKLLLAGRSVEEVENYFTNLKETQTKQLENLNIDRERIESHKSTLNGKIEQLKKDVELNQNEISRLSILIKEWLQNQNHQITAENLKELISKSGEWINQEKQYLTDLKNKELSAKATLKERKSRYLKHLEAEDKPMDEDTKDSLTEILSVAINQIEAINQRLSEIEVSLLSHERGKAHIKSFEKELNEKIDLYENWSKLNELLGSANGNKFKTIAQGYTLDVLLSYANKHLMELSPRYSLEKITDTLALQVMDNDMLGEVRSVHSLSGGESFLISLALALGLSSLSSNKMMIESLFIDEGFGALDIDTLSVAMDALDNLQTQGRKIGVISHVEEMKERISTQIQVIKSANGRSCIKII